MFRFVPRTILALCLLALVVPVSAQDWESVEVKIHVVADGVFMLEGRGGNIGVSVGDDGVFLVDDQFAPLTEKLRAAIRKIGEPPIRFVINTHYHRDHTSGNENLGKAGVLIVAHDGVRRRLSVEDWIQELEEPQKALPFVTFSDTATFHMNGDEIHVFHVPHAHTDGDALVHFRKANAVHMGDTYFHGLYPYIDIDAGGNVNGVIEAADRVLALSDDKTVIVPGHGPLSTRKELKFYRDLLHDVREKVRGMIANGKSLEEIQAAAPSAAYDEAWGNAFIKPDRFVKQIYDSLKP